MSGGQDDSGDKSHLPTPEKLQRLRKEGQIAKSADLITSGAYIGFWLAAVMAGGWSMMTMGRTLAGLVEQSGRLAPSFFNGGAGPLTARLIAEIGTAFAPWVILPAVGALLLAAVQQAIVITPKNLVPKVSRISILSNAKNKFGRGGLFEFGKSTVKLLIFGTILLMVLVSETDHMVSLAQFESKQIATYMAGLVLRLAMIVTIVSLTIGGIDLLWQKAEHIRKNMMSHKELRDEVKESEGDPHMKHQRQQRGREIAMNQMLNDVADAAVVIVNPTHYAVALAWDRSQPHAPKCVAKGVDEIAARIREAAIEAAVPIHHDPPTARALHASIEIGDEIESEHFRAVAAAIRFADDMRRKAKQR